ncbi:killer toxin subunits alpha/beta [Niveomyces insectorum RCEF 264]|uniref:chitinase n=1 Tax=Niveomyces insectorum RCEF 264 TaxID=1081102 RepID=A0A167MP30_9HYPO|nr:killer toxin subunits alpha/beta [Niveomyces insectorum RCEF 264]
MEYGHSKYRLAFGLAVGLLWMAPAAAHTGFEFPDQFSGNPAAGMLRKTCPLSCSAGPIGYSWSSLRSLDELSRCNETQLFEVSVAFPLQAPDRLPGIRACVTRAEEKAEARSIFDPTEPFGPTCAYHAQLLPSNASVDVGVRFSSPNDSTSAQTASVWSVMEAVEQLRRNLLVDPTCDDTIRFAKAGNAIVGLYVGLEIRKATAAPIVERIRDHISERMAQAQSPPMSWVGAQVCGHDGNRPTTQRLGIAVSLRGDLAAVHAAIRDLTAGRCLGNFDKTESIAGGTLGILPGMALTTGLAAGNNRSLQNLPVPKNNSHSSLQSRTSHALFKRVSADNCKVYKVQADDSCWKIANQRCDTAISVDDLTHYNGGASDFCNGIQPGQYVCCTPGDMPDMDPKANPDGSCGYVQVNANDTCAKIAESRCGGISLDQLRRFNGGDKLDCSKLKQRQVICCTEGTPPDLRPKKNADGSCAVHVVGPKELCYQIEDAFMLNPGDVEKFNANKTWAFSDCALLQPNMRVCISDGTPPMPASIPGYYCGPQVPGTQPVPPGNSTKLADLNPCVLNACCDGWGQCGTTDEFCTDTSIDGVPGTHRVGTNGCISHCGTDIVNNSEGPRAFARVAYFEAWNQARPCLHMSVTDVPTSGGPSDVGYTHIHFAFGSISTSDYAISVPDDAADQFRTFVTLKGAARRVLSFGGWAFSTDAATIEVFRQGVTEAHRETFARNVVAFATANNLDGVDFDWEYPGAYDIPGTTPGTPEQGGEYLEFLKLVRQYLPSHITVSIAAPASFWYLRWFPIREISEVVDYIVYMTYDLHGQWDVNNKYASPGCDAGDCLRSHINFTETLNALSMITKAGVPSKKIYVGVSSYGRSFRMSQAGCTGPSCTYLGGRDASDAAPGICTNTSGYLAEAEIRGIMDAGDADIDGTTYTTYHDDASDSDVMVYNDLEWVSWMDRPTKARRLKVYRGLKFGGVSDWAVDLQKDTSPDSAGGSSSSAANATFSGMLLAPCDYQKSYANLDDLNNDAAAMEPSCTTYYVLQILKDTLKTALAGFQDAKDSYDDKFDAYAQYIKDTINSQLLKLMGDDGALLPYFKCYRTGGHVHVGDRGNAEERSCNHREPDGYKEYTWWFDVQNATGLNATLAANGIDPDWVAFDEYVEDMTDECDQFSDHLGGGCPGFSQVNYGFPVRGPNVVVPNPKDVVEKAGAGIDALRDELDDKTFDLILDAWDSDNPDDIAQALALPVFMVADAVDSMQQVKAIGKQVQDEKKKDLILEILQGVLFLIPFVGEAAGALGRIGASIARLLLAFDQLANAGLGVYSIVEDPSMAPVAIMGMLMGAGIGTRSPKDYHVMAGKKIDMETKAPSAAGKTMKDMDPKLNSVMKKSCGE